MNDSRVCFKVGNATFPRGSAQEPVFTIMSLFDDLLLLEDYGEGAEGSKHTYVFRKKA